MTTPNQTSRSDAYIPAPWRFIQHGGEYTLWGSNKRRVLTIRDGVIPMIPDRKLIESAPELIEALETVIKELDHWHSWQLAVNDKYPKSEGSIHTRAILLKADTILQNAKGNVPTAEKNH